MNWNITFHVSCIERVVKGGVWITFDERKNSYFTFHRSKIRNFTKFNELVFNCVDLMPFLTRQPIFTL